MRKRITIIVAGAMASAVLAGGAIASSAPEGTVTGPIAERAANTALEATGGGTANAVEKDTEDGASWEVEVTKTDGTTVDVRLDENYKVVVIEGDTESPDTEDPSD